MCADRVSRATVVVGFVVGLVASLSLGATQPAATADPMTVLLTEVHALRVAMEQSAHVVPRIQLTLARLNIEEQRTTQLAAQLDLVRRQLNDASLESKRLSDQLQDFEKSLQTTTDEEKKRDLESVHRQVKRKLEQQGVIEQQLRARENDAAQFLSAEQARWVDLNARLDELDRLLGPIRQ